MVTMLVITNDHANQSPEWREGRPWGGQTGYGRWWTRRLGPRSWWCTWSPTVGWSPARPLFALLTAWPPSPWFHLCCFPILMIGGLSTLARCSQLCHHLDDQVFNVKHWWLFNADHCEDGDEEEHVGGKEEKDRTNVNPFQVWPALSSCISSKQLRRIIFVFNLSMKAQSEDGLGSERFWCVKTAQVVTMHNGRPARFNWSQWLSNIIFLVLLMMWLGVWARSADFNFQRIRISK